MSRAFTHYWNADTCDWHYSNDHAGNAFEHTAGNGFAAKGIVAGDRIYGFNVFQGALFLIGRMEVKETVSLERARELLGGEIWEAPEHVIGVEGSGTPMYFTRQVPWEIVAQLRFVGSNGEEKGLKFVEDEHLDQQTLRTIRELTAASAALLDEFLALPFKELEADGEEDEDDDDDDEMDDDDDSDISDEDYDDIVLQFGNAEHNREVEKAAVDFVTKYMQSEGYTVVSREQDRCGYDLLCSSEDEEYHVEVKGTSGEAMRFIMTDKEFSTASEDEDYLVCIVTSALSDEPTLSILDVDTLLDHFQYRPLQWAFQYVGEEDEEASE